MEEREATFYAEKQTLKMKWPFSSRPPESLTAGSGSEYFEVEGDVLVWKLAIYCLKPSCHVVDTENVVLSRALIEGEISRPMGKRGSAVLKDILGTHANVKRIKGAASQRKPDEDAKVVQETNDDTKLLIKRAKHLLK